MPGMTSPSSSMINNTNGSMMNHTRHMMMHMTFFWGKNTEVVFSGWPGTSSAMYALCILVLFFTAVLTEWLSHSAVLLRGGWILQTVVYTLRTGLSYLVMLALMSFNGGVFIAVIAGHAVGFLVFGSRVFRGSGDMKTADLPLSRCAC
ncbi:PREDICTED: copper transporter 1-like [Tarenaya hassleriana]|uniref:copper transporter 1-like n=1 Tax=Tarenaya hassleriana TaxID=28532 RepID=UPI00053C7058|nr:PREDICTED: copper transporter 1-like [Tarenaya hassleriana]